MKKVSLLVSFLIIGLLFNGCSMALLPERIEINKLNLIRIVGIDKGIKNPDDICITILTKKIQQQQSGGSENSGQKAEQPLILTNEDPTLMKADREFQTYSDKRMFWGHVEYLLVGEEAAKEGIAKYIDYFVRDTSFRIKANIYIIKGTTAKDFISQSSMGEYYLPDRLEALNENSKLLTGWQGLELLEFLQWLNNKYSSAVAPALCLKEIENPISEDDKPSIDVRLDGYVIFKNLKLVTEINLKQERGENFLLNKVVTSAIQITDPSGKMVAMDIIDNKTDTSPVIKNGKLKGMTVKVEFSSNINEVHSTSDIFDESTLKYLNDEQSKIIKNEIEAVIKIAKDNNADFIDMAGSFEMKRPTMWKKIKDKWDDIFPTIPISVEVKSKINRTYDIIKPNSRFWEEHK